MSAKVISFLDHGEKWKVAFDDGSVRVTVSSRGRMKIISKGEEMNFMDAVGFLSAVSKEFETVVEG
ncbi:hypothetical protein EBZ80_23240 [bacterium]|nr:hypothetical protein [bacterium]